jgi:tRNA threonylcarbamoyladenosine biosynthesis protein TsaB
VAARQRTTIAGARMSTDRLTLAIDTSTDTGSAALGREGRVLAEIVLGPGTRQSTQLLPGIDFLFSQLGAQPGDLERVVVAGGPGSFTGLRIAAATAKGLVAALGLELLAYSGLLVVAAGTGVQAQPVCALFDARRNEVYAACYRIECANGSAQRIDCLLAPRVDRIDDLLALPELAASVYTGEGALRHADRIAAAGGTVLPAPVAVPRASTLLWLAHVAKDLGSVADPRGWEPDYVRATSAERGLHA